MVFPTYVDDQPGATLQLKTKPIFLVVLGPLKRGRVSNYWLKKALLNDPWL